MKKAVLGTALLSTLVQPPQLDQLLEMKWLDGIGIQSAEAAAPASLPSIRGIFRLEKPVRYASFSGAREAYVELVIFDAQGDSRKDPCARVKGPLTYIYRLVDVRTRKLVGSTQPEFIRVMKGENAAPLRFTNYVTSTNACGESLTIFDFAPDFKQLVVDLSLYRHYNYQYDAISIPGVQTRPALKGPMHFVRVR